MNASEHNTPTGECTCGHSRAFHGRREPTWCLHGTLPDSEPWSGDCDCNRFEPTPTEVRECPHDAGVETTPWRRMLQAGVVVRVYPGGEFCVRCGWYLRDTPAPAGFTVGAKR